MHLMRLHPGTNLVLGWATCLRCRQWMEVYVEVEIELELCPVHRGKYRMKEPTVKVIPDEVAAITVWGYPHMGPIAIFADPRQIAGMIWVDR